MKKLLVFSLLLSGCSIGNYQGLTAEEWSTQYYDCTSIFSTVQNERDELQSELSDLESCIEWADDLEEAQNCL